MKQLSINVVKNTTISELVCTPNVILLAKQSIITNSKTGEITTSVRYIEVCKIEKTDALTIVQSLLKYCVSEYYVCNEFEREFADTKIKQRKLFNQFLNGDTIYRTNSEGKVSNALVSEIPLSQTALKVKDTHTIANCDKDNLKAAIFQHSKAILSQCKYLRMIIDKVETLENEQTKTVETIPTMEKVPQLKRKKSNSTAPAVAPSAMVAAPVGL